MRGELPHILVANIFFAPFSYGGATVVAEEVARALVQSGTARVSAVSLVSRAEIRPYQVLRSHVAGIDSYLINVPPSRAYAQMYDDPEIGRVIDELITSLKPDLVHAHCVQEMGVGVLRVAKRAGIPLVLSVHDFWWICERQFMVRLDEVYCGQSPVQIEACKGCVGDHAAAVKRFGVLQETANLADIVTYPSRFALELCEASGLAPGKGVHWENGITLPGSEFFSEQTARRKRGGAHVFGYLGGPSHLKGWPLVKRAFAALDRDDFEVVVVDGSPDGSWWDASMFERLPGKWRVLPRFDQSQIDDFYSQIDTLLFLSQWKETFGLAIREAKARGIEVIQTDSGGSVEHEAVSSSRLVPIGDHAQLVAHHMAEILDTGATVSPFDAQLDFAGQAREFRKLTAPLGITYPEEHGGRLIDFPKRA